MGKLQSELTDAHTTYEKGLRARALFKVHDQFMSDDLVQNTFLKTWTYLVRGGKVDTMRAFLHHVLNDLIIDEYRKRKTMSLDMLIEKGFDLSADNSEQVINFLDGKEAMLLIQKLPLKYQNVLRMRYEKGLTLKEMALLTGQSENTVAVQCHRGLAKFKVLYEHSPRAMVMPSHNHLL